MTEDEVNMHNGKADAVNEAAAVVADPTSNNNNKLSLDFEKSTESSEEVLVADTVMASPLSSPATAPAVVTAAQPKPTGSDVDRYRIILPSHIHV